MPKLTDQQKDSAIELFRSVQTRLLKALEAVDGHAKAERSSWDRSGGGGGTMAVIRGKTVEKAGVNVSVVHGDAFPGEEAASAGKPFFATGVSSVTHMYNPQAPIGHMNVRLIEAGDDFWVGGGGDLTPYLSFDDDTNMFHASFKKACDEFDPQAYDKYSKWCDEYFYIKHRQSPRGVGGIFFDYLKGDFERLLGFLSAVANAYVETFPSILSRRKDLAFTDEEKEGQLYWRGRYAEFNLVYDRGTKFGLQSGGNTDAIFVSMPPVVKW